MKISIIVITYNQEKYIKQTLDSIINQKHSYSYEIIIGDDCSTDNTPAILQYYQDKFPCVIKVINNPINLGGIQNYYNVLSYCTGEYIMECAGDDYWLDNKITTQIEFMEANRNCGMCYGKAKVFYDSLNKIKDDETFGLDRTNFFCILREGNVIPAPSVCIRKKVMDLYINEINPQNKNWLMEDYPTWLWFSHESNIIFIDNFMCVYRKIDSSLSHPIDLHKKELITKNYYDINVFFANYFLVPKDAYLTYEKLFFQTLFADLCENFRHDYFLKFNESYHSIKNKTIAEKIKYFIINHPVWLKIFKFFRNL